MERTATEITYLNHNVPILKKKKRSCASKPIWKANILE